MFLFDEAVRVRRGVFEIYLPDGSLRVKTRSGHVYRLWDKNPSFFAWDATKLA